MLVKRRASYIPVRPRTYVPDSSVIPPDPNQGDIWRVEWTAPKCEWSELATRYYGLRTQGSDFGREFVRPVLQDEPRLYVFDNPMDPWGSKKRITLQEFRRMVEEGEVARGEWMKGMRKDVQSTSSESVRVEAKEA